MANSACQRMFTLPRLPAVCLQGGAKRTTPLAANILHIAKSGSKTLETKHNKIFGYGKSLVHAIKKREKTNTRRESYLEKHCVALVQDAV